MTDDLTKRIKMELARLLGDVHHYLAAVHVRKGWGDILYVTVRLNATGLDDRGELEARLKSAVHSLLGGIRHLVTIEWVALD